MTGFLWSSSLTIIVGLLACWIICGKLPRRYHRLAYIFVAYLILIVVCAFAYSSLYQNDQNRFAFNADIIRARKREVIATGEVARLRLAKRIEALQQLRALLATWKDPVPVDTGVTDIVRLKTATYEFEFELTYLWTPSPNGRLYSTDPLHVYKPTDNAHWTEYVRLEGPSLSTYRTDEFRREIEKVAPPRSAKVYHDMVSAVIERLARQMPDQPGSAADSSESTDDEWTFFDFLYFSVITQTTVGYGDILPNKTEVRLVVMLQIILGLLLLGFVVTIVASELSGARNGAVQPSAGADD